MKQLIKSIILTVIATMVYLPLHANDAQFLGKPLTLSDVTNISQILATPEEYVGKRVLVKGTVVDVCAKRGCWVDIASDKAFEKIQIKVLDGEIVLPMSARGKDYGVIR